MRIGNVSNVSFKATYYEGYSKYKNSDDKFHFEIKNTRPDKYLTENQKEITQIIKDEIDKTCVCDDKLPLTYALSERKCDFWFRYPDKNTVETSIVKWNTGSWGDEFCYTPYNKKGDKKIKITFVLNKMPTIEQLKSTTRQFISDCTEFLTDNNNSKNKEIEKYFWDRY